MRRMLWQMVVAIMVGVTGTMTASAAPVNPSPAGRDLGRCGWYWLRGSDPDPLRQAAGRVYFRREFSLAGEMPEEAIFWGAVDNSAKVYMNGQPVGELPDWSRPIPLEVKHLLRPGTNVLAIEAVNGEPAGNPAGLVGQLWMRFAGATTQSLPVDRSWRVSPQAGPGWLEAGYPAAGWAQAELIGPMGCGPWLTLEGSRLIAPPGFPSFRVPGQAQHMALLSSFFFDHFPRQGAGTLWDGWLPYSTVWVADDFGAGYPVSRERYGRELAERRQLSDGYISTHQHLGLAHPEGWPFPIYAQSGTSGWLFADFQPYGREFGIQLQHDLAGWRLNGAKFTGIERDGAKLELTTAGAVLETPDLNATSATMHFVRILWTADESLAQANPYVEWNTVEEPGFSPQRRVYFSRPAQAHTAVDVAIPLYQHPLMHGKIQRLRVGLDNAGPGRITLKALFPIVDSRHNINNAVWLQGCDDYLRWSGDLTFLREQIGRMRLGLAYALNEFEVRRYGMVWTPWPGKNGESGLTVGADGNPNGRVLGGGIGNNYWDLLPFGGFDFLATTYLYDALLRMAALEERIAANPGWNIPGGPLRQDPADLRALAAELRRRSNEFFWNPVTGRFFGAKTKAGRGWDFGLTMVNCEAIFYGIASEEHARSIMDWIEGRRMVAGDTAQGADIYRWRLAPRATTRRNLEWYTNVWPAPQSIQFGDQVQDGGAVLGFSYHDLEARLRVDGPDNAWARLEAILQWLKEVQAVGGYRSYYAHPGRGTLQGGGPPGGIGIDREFFESVLVPQIMLYGFMGVRPEIDGLSLHPKLPHDFPELTITGIDWQGLGFDLTAREDGTIELAAFRGAKAALALRLPAGSWRMECAGAGPVEARQFASDGKAIAVVTPIRAGGCIRLKPTPAAAFAPSLP